MWTDPKEQEELDLKLRSTQADSAKSGTGERFHIKD